jgi:tRNA 2-thiouridine synthesizing protein E
MAEAGDIYIVATAYVDQDGYLLASAKWNKEVGQLLAFGVVPGCLTEDHWKIVEYLRQYYLKSGTVPPVRKLCRDTGFDPRTIYKLFPSGLARGACKIAGIPRSTFLQPLTCLYP